MRHKGKFRVLTESVKNNSIAYILTDISRAHLEIKYNKMTLFNMQYNKSLENVLSPSSVIPTRLSYIPQLYIRRR